MRTRNKKSGFFKAGALALALSSTFVASQAWALTLGRLSAQSNVGQPLRATLEVPAITAQQAATMQIRVAGPDRFAAASMVLNSVLNEARFELLPVTNGQTSIRIQTSRPVTEPFLDLVLEFVWGGGQLVRTYTLLLDPPNLQTSQPQNAASVLAPALSANTLPLPRFEPLEPIAAAPTPAPATVRTEPNLVREIPQTTTAEAAPVLSPPPVRAEPELVRELPAPRLTAPEATAPASVATPLVREVLEPTAEAPVSLVREITETTQAPVPARTQAPAPAPTGRFEPLESTSVRVLRGDTAGRIAANNLPPGVSLDQMLVAMLQSNPQAFINGNVNLIRAGARIQLPDFNEASRVTPQEARQMVRAQTRDFNEYRRRLASAAPLQVTPEAGQTIAGTVQEAVEVSTPASTEPDRLELSRGTVTERESTESIAQQRQEEATQSRLDELDRNLKELEALAQTAGADNQDGPTQRDDESSTDLLSIATDSAATADDEGRELEAMADAAELTPAEKAESIVERWLKNPWTVPLALLLIAVLGLLGWTRARAQRKQDAFKATAEPSSQPAAFEPAYVPEPASPKASPAPVAAGASNDPISEAEVYLAYGMEDQAENLLRQALAANPGGLPERLKLLEVYQSRGDVMAFNTLAQEVFEITLGETEEWEQVARAGIKLDPSNPLYHPVYGEGVTPGELPSDIKDLSLDLGGLDTANDGNKRQP